MEYFFISIMIVSEEIIVDKCVFDFIGYWVKLVLFLFIFGFNRLVNVCKLV